MANITLPSDLELQALSVVYSEGACTVATVHSEMPDQRDRAYTTILSVMQSLERKGLVKTERAGRAYVYHPTQSQERVVTPLAKEFVQNAFGGSVGRAILLLLSTGNLTPEEKSALESELKQHKAMAAKKKTTKRKAAAKRKPAKRAVKRKVAKKVTKRKPAKKAAKKKVAKRKPAKKAAKKKAAKRKPAKKAKKKAAKKKVAKRKPAKKAKKKAAKKKVAKRKAAKRKPAKKAAKKKVAKKAKKKAAKRKVARKRK